jgi:hypothetical protein
MSKKQKDDGLMLQGNETKSKAISRMVQDGTVLPSITPELGSSLVSEGMARLRHEYSERVVEYTLRTIQNIKQLQHQIDDAIIWKQFQEARLAAIEAGDFTLDRNALPWFNDNRLNQGNDQGR